MAWSPTVPSERFTIRRVVALVGVVAGMAAIATVGGTGSIQASNPPPPADTSSSSRCGNVQQRPWCDTTLSPDRRATLLLAALSPDERIQLLGADLRGSGPHTGASLGIPRVGVPPVYYSDGPVGPRQGSATAMPIPMALAATFDPSIAVAHGSEIANEAKLKGTTSCSPRR